MAKDLIRVTNDAKGFLRLLILEALVGVWALAATLYAVYADRRRTVLYGLVTLLAVCYIFGRSLRNYLNIRRKEREERGKGEDKHGA